MIILEDLKDIIIDFWLELDGKDKLMCYDMYLLSAQYISRGQY